MATTKKVVPPDMLQRIRGIVARDGAAKVCKRWGMTKDTLACALAGYQVQAGSIALITLGLQKEEGER